jgi:hypothetical protein
MDRRPAQETNMVQKKLNISSVLYIFGYNILELNYGG